MHIVGSRYPIPSFGPASETVPCRVSDEVEDNRGGKAVWASDVEDSYSGSHYSELHGVCHYGLVSIRSAGFCASHLPYRCSSRFNCRLSLMFRTCCRRNSSLFLFSSGRVFFRGTFSIFSTLVFRETILGTSLHSSFPFSSIFQSVSSVKSLHRFKRSSSIGSFDSCFVFC